MDTGPRPTDAGRARPDARVSLPDAGPLDAGPTVPDGGDVDGGPPAPTDVRFVVMGDTGEGNDGQRAVAEAVRTTCASLGCDFVILLGDNIYDSGVSGVDDPQWQTKFEEPYAAIELPFYPVLGNHDYGGVLPILGGDQGGLGNEFHKGPIAVQYTQRSDRWTLPATFYTLRFGNVGFVMLDTNSILWDDTENGDQWAWFDGAVAQLRADGAEWIIGAGHHPVRSNGAHGNAGSYESFEVGGTDIPIPVPIMDGRNVEDFMAERVCGEVDMYMAGHDHNRQWIDEPGALCGATLIVSGAGAKVKGFDRDDRNATLWQEDAVEGFFHFVIEGDTLHGRAFDRDGAMEFENMMERPSATP